MICTVLLHFCCRCGPDSCRNRSADGDGCCTLHDNLMVLFGLLLAGWTIYGATVVFPFGTEAPPDCDDTTFWFAFACVVAGLVSFCILVVALVLSDYYQFPLFLDHIEEEELRNVETRRKFLDL